MAKQLEADPRTNAAYVQRLEDDLYITREALVRLAAPNLADDLLGFHGLKDSSAAFHWLKEKTATVLESAQLVEAPNNAAPAWSWPRARCPLCGESAREKYLPNSGFAFPDGLRRHLEGEGNTTACVVMGAVRQLAYGSVRDQGVRGSTASP